jgi:hypothetical protein
VVADVRSANNRQIKTLGSRIDHDFVRRAAGKISRWRALSPRKKTFPALPVHLGCNTRGIAAGIGKSRSR